jgi:hypothetical protein
MFDPFFAQKLNTYKASGTAVHRMNTLPFFPNDKPIYCQRHVGVGLALTLAELESEKNIVANDPEKLKVLFQEMTQMCLWCVSSSVTRRRDLSQLLQGKRHCRFLCTPMAYHADSPFIRILAF